MGSLITRLYYPIAVPFFCFGLLMACSIDLSILLFLLLLQVLVTNILPPSSISLPLYAKYLLFTVIVDVCCIANTVVVLNCNYRTPRTHRMPGWIRVLFLDWIPRVLFMQRPGNSSSTTSNANDPLGQAIAVAVASSRLPTYTPDTMRRGGFVGTSTFETVDVHHPDCPYGRTSTLRQRNKASDVGSAAGSDKPTHVTPEMNKAIEATYMEYTLFVLTHVCFPFSIFRPTPRSHLPSDFHSRWLKRRGLLQQFIYWG
jgi:nicotinic acetylcholine receptor